DSRIETHRPRQGLRLDRRFTEELGQGNGSSGADPEPAHEAWSTVTWVERTASIGDGEGKTVFEQAGIEAPEGWSQLAINVVASKYFRGHVGTPERES